MHRRGTARLAEETESTAYTWYPPDEVAALVSEAGFNDVQIGPPVRALGDAETYSIVARL